MTPQKFAMDAERKVNATWMLALCRLNYAVLSGMQTLKMLRKWSWSHSNKQKPSQAECGKYISSFCCWQQATADTSNGDDEDIDAIHAVVFLQNSTKPATNVTRGLATGRSMLKCLPEKRQSISDGFTSRLDVRDKNGWLWTIRQYTYRWHTHTTCYTWHLLNGQSPHLWLSARAHIKEITLNGPIRVASQTPQPNQKI